MMASSRRLSLCEKFSEIIDSLSFLQIHPHLGGDTRSGDLAFDDRPDQLRCDLPPDYNVLFIVMLRFRFCSRYMQESNPSRLVGLEALRQTVEVYIVTKEMARVGGYIQRNVVVLSIHVSILFLAPPPLSSSSSLPQPTYRQVLLPPAMHILYIQVCRQLARDTIPWPLGTVWILHGHCAIQIPYPVVVSMAQLLQSVLWLRGRHANVQHEINPGNAAEFGLP